MKYAWIEHHRWCWPVSVQCEVLGVRPSGYHEHFRRRASPQRRKRLSNDALRMAWFRRHPAKGLIFHSDRRSQYCSNKSEAALGAYGMRSSMSRKGDCWDNAPTESLWT